MVAEFGGGLVQLSRQSASAEVAGGANFERQGALGKQAHQVRIASCGDAMSDAFDSEQGDGVADGFGSADFSGVHQAVQTT